jgi:hypothetical protein
MSESATPALSVILVADTYEKIAPVIAAFAAQSVSKSIEMVIVLPKDAPDDTDPGRFADFFALNLVKLDHVLPMGPSRAAGIRAATAPVVFVGETHSFPLAGFAEAIIEAHRNPWEVIVPGIGNANPSGARSWSSYLLDYGYWFSGLAAAEVPSGPTWNASYKRDVLIGLGPLLDNSMSSGDALPMALKARNCRYWFEPRARLIHVNLESRGWADERYLSGLVVGANRGKRWSFGRRLFYFAASPLIPFVLIYRLSSGLRQLYVERLLPAGTGAALVAGSIVRTFGEAVGYLIGLSPAAEARMEEYELNKVQYVSRVLHPDEAG